MPHNILPALIDKLHQHNPHLQWTHSSPNTAITQNYDTMILQLHETTLTLTSYHHNDNNPIQSEPDEITATTNILDPDFLQKLLQDPRLQPRK